jgi:putative transposase
MKRTTLSQRTSTTDTISYVGYRFPPDVIRYAAWLYYRFPLSLRTVEELLAARGIDLTYDTVRRWSVKFGLRIVRRIRSSALARGDGRRLDEVVVTVNGRKQWLRRAVDQYRAVLDVPVQSRRDRHAARHLMRKLLRKHGCASRELVTDKLRSYAAANRHLVPIVEHRQHKGVNNRAENSHQPRRGREKGKRRVKSARHPQRFASVHDQAGKLFMHCRYQTDAK